MTPQEEKRAKWYFTFGCGHGNYMFYVRLYGTREATRTRMFELFGGTWSFQYSEKQRTSMNWDYKLHPISLTDEANA